MIAAWMLFALEISALLFVAAWVGERALLAARGGLRWVWMTAIVGANLLPLLLSQLTISSRFTNRWALSVAPQSVLSSMSALLLTFWLVAFAIGLFVCLSAAWRMSRTRRTWKAEHVDSTPVLVSHDIGPALVGVLHYSIVVPEWAYSLEKSARRLLLTHEREHARHYDPLLLTAAAIAVVVAPWNLFNWLFFRRLHLAVELDCDRRVLRAHPDTAGYGALLLDVAERVLPSVMPAAAFVEHGASLETRINAMGARKKSFQSVRVASGLAASLMLAGAACFTPQPYAIIIVNPPTMGMAPVASAPTGAVGAGVEPAASEHAAHSAQPAPAVVQKYLDAAAATPSRTVLGGNEAEIRPMAPSARVKALDAAEVARMRAILLEVAPSTLGAWPRADSALLLLFHSNGTVAKQTVVARARLGTTWNALGVFSTAFPGPEVNGIEVASEYTIDRGLRGELLSDPLTLYAAHLLSGLPVPLTRDEIIPSREAMLALVRARHPEVLADTVESVQVSALLYDSKGTLLKSAAVTMDSSPKLADGSYNDVYERQVWRKAFGAVMDSGTVKQSGTLSFLTGKRLDAGPAKIMYAVLSKRSDFNVIQELVGNRRRNWSFGGIASRPNNRGVFDFSVLTARLRVLVHTRVPDAYGDWARGDSAVVFLLDAEDQLIARKAGPIPKNFGMQPLADYISLRVLTVPAADMDRVGWTYHVASEAGRVLDKPLMVIWGRLSAEATRKLRQ